MKMLNYILGHVRQLGEKSTEQRTWRQSGLYLNLFRTTENLARYRMHRKKQSRVPDL